MWGTHLRLGRVVIGSAIAVALIAVAWTLVLPWASDTILGERPDDLDDFARLCEDEGASLGGAAAYSEQVPHPGVLFSEGGSSPTHALGEDGTDPLPAEVQIVACSRRAHVSDEPVESCDYGFGPGNPVLGTVNVYQARYRVDVYEAHTGHRIGSRMLVGYASEECPSRASADEPDFYTFPGWGQYNNVLEEFVTGEQDPNQGPHTQAAAREVRAVAIRADRLLRVRWRVIRVIAAPALRVTHHLGRHNTHDQANYPPNGP
ncbi:hypothetical protein GCM10022245_45360 [Streptomyces mayteni]